MSFISGIVFLVLEQADVNPVPYSNSTAHTYARYVLAQDHILVAGSRRYKGLQVALSSLLAFPRSRESCWRCAGHERKDRPGPTTTVLCYTFGMAFKSISMAFSPLWRSVERIIMCISLRSGRFRLRLTC